MTDQPQQKQQQQQRPRPEIGTELAVPENVAIRICKKSGHVTFRAFLSEGEWKVRVATDPHGGLVLRTKDKLILGKPYTAKVERYTRHGKGDSAWVSLKQKS